MNDKYNIVLNRIELEKSYLTTLCHEHKGNTTELNQVLKRSCGYMLDMIEMANMFELINYDEVMELSRLVTKIKGEYLLQIGQC